MEVNILSPDEEKLLAALGYLVMRWNLAEHCARQILRKYLLGESIYDKDQLKLTKQPAGGIEYDLKRLALPKWQNPGRKFLEHLIAAYASGRKHRNNIVHGIYSTTCARGEWSAHATLISWHPESEKLAPFVDLETMQRAALHFHDLAKFAREVSLTFNQDGSIACNKDGSPVMADLPTVVSPLADIDNTNEVKATP